jgi:pantetheine-phosphate adenylyltransferase
VSGLLAEHEMKKLLAVYPGSFDPITNGHLDIIERGLHVFGELTVLVAYNEAKTSLFSVEERKELVAASVNNDPRVHVTSFDGLLVEYARNIGASVVLRGLRAVADFEYEFQMANMNRHLDSHIETIFMMTGADNFYVSSSLVRKAASLGGDIDELVPAAVAKALRDRYPQD